MFYRDLTYYSKHHFENALNVGFDSIKKIDNTAYDRKLVDALILFLKFPFNMVFNSSLQNENVGIKKELGLGFSEIRVISQEGQVFAAPDTVISEIVECGYDPPAPFKKAVMDGVSPNSKEYEAYCARYNASKLWGSTDEYIETIGKVSYIIHRGDLKALEEFLATNNQDALVTSNGSLLNEAIVAGQENLANYLIECDCLIDRFDGIELLTAIECGMESIVEKLLSRQIVIKTDFPMNNPLFFAIANHKNRIAKKLYKEKRELVVTYNTEHTRKCNILQWSKMFKNESFLSFLRNQL